MFSLIPLNILLALLVSYVYSASISKISEQKNVNLRVKRSYSEVTDQESFNYDGINQDNIESNILKPKRHLRGINDGTERRKGMPVMNMMKPITTTTLPTTTTESQFDQDHQDNSIFGDSIDNNESFSDLGDDEEPGESPKIKSHISFNNNQVPKEQSDPRSKSSKVKEGISSKPTFMNSDQEGGEHQEGEQIVDLGPDETTDLKRPMNIWGTGNIIIFNSKIYCRTNSILA